MTSRYRKVLSLSKEWFFNKRFFANCCISSGMLVVGDVLQQSYEIFVKRQSEFHLHRIFKMGYAGFATGAYGHHLYGWLDRRWPGKDLATLTKKVILDNLSAPLGFLLFFAVLAVMERKRLQEFSHELYTKGVHLYLTSSVIYAPAQYFNFYFLAPQHRVLFVSSLNLLFDTYSSYVAHQVDRHEAFESQLPANCHL
ncbi:putative Mpv17-like protein 2 [Hypsibius exemplaris]|uniref:Mpv17-like protein 2 n=1 Tax=Hypsibius exemplaris TaxID=2072580 RepID=A0A1W0WS27_HYPEX|nr:putative Mpv17-like protein 2 [Hypsibius exemplaris]